jgi:phosphate transport system substrate-binding protein
VGRGLQGATGNQVNYQGIGSSGGVKQIKAKTVDFGGTDAPSRKRNWMPCRSGAGPTVMGGVTIVMNVPGIESGKLKLDGPPPPTCSAVPSRSGTIPPSPS